MIVFPFVGDSIGGSYYSAVSLILALQSEGVECRIFVFDKRGPFIEYLKKKRIGYNYIEPVIKFREHRPLVTAITILCNLRRIHENFRKFNIKWIISNDIRMNLFFTAYQIIFSVNHCWIQRKVIPQNIIFQGLMSLNSRVVSVSEFVALGIKNVRLKQRNHVIGNIFEIPISAGKDASEYEVLQRSNGDSLIVGFIGPLREQKGVALLEGIIRALPKKPIKFKIFCGNASASLLEDPDNHHAIEYFDHLAQHKIFASIDCLLCLGADEGFGRTIVEARVNGVPVLAVRSGGHLDAAKLLGDETILIDDTVEAFVEKLLSLQTRMMTAGNIAHTHNRVRQSNRGIIEQWQSEIL